ncbi:acetyltransferase (GNAT) domain-containing protein [Ditylenchus destructor]|uniref:Acetyltransferase (GNAT) domain-containing protein n=1 Tax=Ditylenchus destructor TaxID=166010 RepID=A0AAD4QXU5_9BILA|nr:acetyltransferase (GNAT) domain-containing protein [Ditylenchus destructor]
MATIGTKSDAENSLSKMDLKIVKTITQEQWLNVIHTIVDQLGWNNSESDLEIWRKKSGRAIGVATRSDYSLPGSEKLSGIGLFYVRPEYRGKDIGKALFQAVIDDCAEKKFLYGAMAMWEKYATRSGFSQIPTWRMLFISIETSYLDLSSLEDQHRTDHTDPEFQIKHWREVDLDSIIKLDLQVTNGMDRRTYMKATLEQPKTWTMIATECQTGDVIGICRAREVIGDHLDIGPFYATSPKVAGRLLRRTITSVPNWRLRSRIDFKPPSNNADAVKLINQIAREKRKESFLVPQFTHEIVPMDNALVYSVTETDCTFI